MVCEEWGVRESARWCISPGEGAGYEGCKKAATTAITAITAARAQAFDRARRHASSQICCNMLPLDHIRRHRQTLGPNVKQPTTHPMLCV